MSYRSCECTLPKHSSPKLVVLTGGPGAGKTAVLEIARRNLCEHVAVLPEAASIIFGGGFWRHESLSARKAAQRAIFHVQRESEKLAYEEGKYAVLLCDRGTLDGLAYWPGLDAEFFQELGTTREDELSRYSSVIHLRTPALHQGYNRRNPVRIESAELAAELDRKIALAWRGHSSWNEVASAGDFLDKARAAIELIRAQLPECCKQHSFEELRQN